MMKKMLFAAAAMATVTAGPVAAQAGSITPMTPQEYVAAAGASDLYERTSSQLVLESTQDPNIRRFAQAMIQHHNKSTADVKAAAARARIKAAPPMLTPTQRELIAQLQSDSGPARDRAYVAQQKVSHNQALAVQTAYAADGTAAPLKAAAAGIVPVVQRHIELLKAM